MTSEKTRIDEVESKAPKKLKDADLEVNESKTERYAIPHSERNEVLNEHNYSKPIDTNEWKKCKLLGSHLDTETEIKHRKNLLITNMKNNTHIYKSHKVNLKNKIRNFTCYEESIFLYNCEIWTLTKTMNNTIDAFQRKKLRHAIGIYYPKKISNEDLYKKTKQVAWSKKIKRRRLKYFGHVCRMDESTPAKQALIETIKQNTIRKQGKPKLTWLQTVINDLKELGIIPNIDFKNIFELANDSDRWRSTIVKPAIRQKSVQSRGKQ